MNSQVGANRGDSAEPRRHPPIRIGPEGSASSGHPLGSLLVWRRLDSPIAGRMYAMGLAAGLLAVLVAAGVIHPGDRSMGTHQQLGLPPCGFEMMTRLPCPTCGMTTAFAYTVRGDWGAAIYAQAAGFILAILCMLMGGMALVAVVAGGYPSLNWYRIRPTTVLWWSVSVFVLAWGVKIGLVLLARNPAGG